MRLSAHLRLRFPDIRKLPIPLFKSSRLMCCMLEGRAMSSRHTQTQRVTLYLQTPHGTAMEWPTTKSVLCEVKSYLRMVQMLQLQGDGYLTWLHVQWPSTWQVSVSLRSTVLAVNWHLLLRYNGIPYGDACWACIARHPKRQQCCLHDVSGLDHLLRLQVANAPAQRITASQTTFGGYPQSDSVSFQALHA